MRKGINILAEIKNLSEDTRAYRCTEGKIWITGDTISCCLIWREPEHYLGFKWTVWKKIHKIFNILKLITIATIRQLIQYPQIAPVLICHKWKLKYFNVTEKLQSFKLCKMRTKCQCRNIATASIRLGKKKWTCGHNCFAKKISKKGIRD